MAKLRPINTTWISPDLGDLIFLGLLYLLFVLKPNYLFSDASIGWHIAAGNYIIEHHAVPHVDLFSYTFANKPWTDYEWLFHLIMALLVRLGGLNLLAVVSGCVLALVFLFLYERCRKESAHFLFAVAIVLVGEIVSSVHWLARPHLVTLVGVYLFYVTLEDFYRGSLSGRCLALTIIPFMIFWTNCHPGFLFGLVILGIYLTAALVHFVLLDKSGEKRKSSLDRLKAVFFCFLASILATLVNPYGPKLYAYIVQYLLQGMVLAVTNEFQSPVFHGALQPACLELLFALLIIGLAFSKRPITFPSLLMALAFAHLSLASVRNMPLFAVVAVPLIARAFSKSIWSPSQAPESRFSSLSNSAQLILHKLADLDAQFSKTEALCKAHFWPIAAFVILSIAAVNGGQLFGAIVVNSGFDTGEVPTSTLNTIKTFNLDPRQGFNYDNWGGYMHYKLDIPVFIDDRADFYGGNFYAEYGAVSETAPNWAKILDKYQVNWVLFPKNSNLVYALKGSPDWKLAADDEAAALFLRVKGIQKRN